MIMSARRRRNAWRRASVPCWRGSALRTPTRSPEASSLAVGGHEPANQLHAIHRHLEHVALTARRLRHDEARLERTEAHDDVVALEALDRCVYGSAGAAPLAEVVHLPTRGDREAHVFALPIADIGGARRRDGLRARDEQPPGGKCQEAARGSQGAPFDRRFPHSSPPASTNPRSLACPSCSP